MTRGVLIDVAALKGVAVLPGTYEITFNLSGFEPNVRTGIELHVREDSPAAREDALTAMREAVRAALGRPELR